MDTQRLILLLVFTFSVVMLWDAWQKEHSAKTGPAVTTQAGIGNQAAGDVPVAPKVVTPSVAGSVADAGPASVQGVTFKTDVLAVEVSPTGGELARVELLKHRATDDAGRNFVLLDSRSKERYAAQSGVIGEGMPNHKSAFVVEDGPRELKDGEDVLHVRLRGTGPGGSVNKVYTFHRGSYVVDVMQEIEGGDTAAQKFGYFQFVRTGDAAPGNTVMMSTFTGAAVYTAEDKYQKLEFSDIEKGKAKFRQKADNGWIAIVQHYFASAWIPGGTLEHEFYTRKVAENLYTSGVVVPAVSDAGKVVARARLFVGPQEQDKLEGIAPGLGLVVDYGWLHIIAAPLFWVLQWFHKLLGNWGWAIVALTVLLKLVFFPLSAASYRSMARMRVLTPRLQQLKERCGDDKARLNQEMMELYRKEKINPLGGCLPIAVQIPVFIALYWVLLGTLEIRHAPWILWIKDLSAMDPYYVLPLIMGATMFIQTKLNPAPPDPIQAKVMLFMPVIFTGMFLFFPAGLVLYWTVNNVLSIAQQWQITRLIESGQAKSS